MYQFQFTMAHEQHNCSPEQKYQRACEAISRSTKFQRLGGGGAKQIHAINQSKWAIATPLNYRETSLKQWLAMIRSEIDIAKQVRAAGLLAQNYSWHEQTTTVQGLSYQLPVLRMHNFRFLSDQGLQVRDRKGGKHYDDSTLFGTIKLLASPEHWSLLTEWIEADLMVYFSKGLIIPDIDSWNLAIQDTDQTTDTAVTQSKIVTHRKQKIRLYFYDFSSKFQHRTTQNRLKAIEKKDIERVINIFVIPAIFSAISKEELMQLQLSSDNPASLTRDVLAAIAKPALTQLIPSMAARINAVLKHSEQEKEQSHATPGRPDEDSAANPQPRFFFVDRLHHAHKKPGTLVSRIEATQRTEAALQRATLGFAL